MAAERRRAAHLGPERRRPLVLDAALALFADRGYDGVSVDDIAASAGVTKPVLYARFGEWGPGCCSTSRVAGRPNGSRRCSPRRSAEFRVDEIPTVG
jgi:hypothetical protein